MDDDDERRGRPTVHVVFGEAVAILAGDALLTEAFSVLVSLGARAADGVSVLAHRAGVAHLLAGQARDLATRGTPPRNIDELELIHRGKTGALFAAAAELGGITAGADAEARGRLALYGMDLGIAFQHADDLADEDNAALAPDARRRVRELIAEARAAITPFGPRGDRLGALADWVARSVR
jgi:geranylgeranyl pyrophosphate synthase